MKNIKRLYLSYTFNRPNIIILFVSILLIFALLNLYNFDILDYDYQEDISYYNDIRLT